LEEKIPKEKIIYLSRGMELTERGVVLLRKGEGSIIVMGVI